MAMSWTRHASAMERCIPCAKSWGQGGQVARSLGGTGDAHSPRETEALGNPNRSRFCWRYILPLKEHNATLHNLADKRPVAR